ncbi:MAG: hypothetical protein M3O90_00505 [Actinomycetota bacterium]|nr:hypothetical protein [Actinomycetota bacterium]
MLSLTYACVGAVVAARVPENPIGWMFCVTGLAFGLAMLGYEYARYGLYATAGVVGLARRGRRVQRSCVTA